MLWPDLIIGTGALALLWPCLWLVDKLLGGR